MYYKNVENELFFDPSTEVINMHALSEITEAEFNQILEEKNRFIPTWENQGREKRNQLLAETDWAFLSDHVDEGLQNLRDYRQALRDLPSVYVDYTQVVWPAKPA